MTRVNLPDIYKLNGRLIMYIMPTVSAHAQLPFKLIVKIAACIGAYT